MLVRTHLIPGGFDAFTVWPFIFVRPGMESNAGLIAHETVHLKEQRAAWVLPWLLRYWLSRAFRLEAEKRAYAVQLEMGALTAQQVAEYMARY